MAPSPTCSTTDCDTATPGHSEDEIENDAQTGVDLGERVVIE